MADNSVIGIDVVARLDQFRAEMAKLPGITAADAKAMSAELNKSIQSATRNAAAAA